MPPLFLAAASLIIGGLISQISEDLNKKDAQENYDHMYGTDTTDGTIDKERKEKLSELAENYQIEKDAVNENATRSETTLNNSAKNDFDSLLNNMLGNAESFNTSNMQLGQNKGNELSQMASSGARSSSMNEAIELESAVNNEQLQLQQTQTRNSNNYQINSLLNNIGSERNNLQESRLSFEEGGTANRKYKASIESINNAYDRQKEELTYEYEQWKGGRSSRILFGMIGNASSTFNFFNSVDLTKISFNSFGNTGLTGELAGKYKTSGTGLFTKDTGFSNYVKNTNSKLFK